MTKATSKKQYWRVDFGFRWERTSFLFSTAEDAAVFCENAAEHYSKILTDTENHLQATITLVSDEEYSEIVAAYEKEHAPAENE